MKRDLGVAVAVLAMFIAACAATPTKSESTPFRVYSAPPDKVFDASVVAFQNLGLELFKQDKAQGYIEGGRSPGFGRGAETVGVFIEQESHGQTKVSVDNNQAFWGSAFAVDWTDRLFKQIAAALGGST